MTPDAPQSAQNLRHEGPLVDRFGRRVRYLRLSITNRCNFRCVYCMPADGVKFMPRKKILTFEEIERLVRVFVELGVEKVRLTGGEPTLRRDLPVLVRKLSAIDGVRELAMTTNAFLLARMAHELRDAGLDRLNVSLDSLDPTRFRALTRVGDLAAVERGLEAAADAGFTRTKLNAVVIRGFNDDELLDLVAWAGARQLELRFIEFMPIGADAVRWGEHACVPAAEMRQRLAAVYRIEHPAPDAGAPTAGPARTMRLHGPHTPPEGQPVGIISAVSECFCAGCNRVRMTCEGKLRACLADDRERDLRAVLRNGGSDDDLADAVRVALLGKKETHAFADGAAGGTTRIMTTIGG